LFGNRFAFRAGHFGFLAGKKLQSVEE